MKTPTIGFETTVSLVFSGTATGGGTDYTASASAITILEDEATGTSTFSTENDVLVEGDETVIVDIDEKFN